MAGDKVQVLSRILLNMVVEKEKLLQKKIVIENIVSKHKRVDICSPLFNTTVFNSLLK